MAIKDQAVNLILRAKNFLSGDTDSAAKSVDGLSSSAERLKGELRQLEDNRELVKQFSAAEKAVDRTSQAYDRARLRADKLADKLTKVGVPTQRQAQEFEAAQRAVAAAEREYRRAEVSLGDLAGEAQAAGINIEDLNGEQRRMAQRSKEASRELQDLNNEVEEGDSRFLSFRKTLSNGVVTLGKWAAAAAAATTALAVGALTRFTSSQSELAKQTLASARAFDIGAEALQEWQYASEEVGISGEKTADIMKDVAEKIGDAFLTGGGEAAEVIEELNLDIEKLIRLKPDEQILAVAEQLNGLPKPAQIQILESLASDASLLLPLLDNNAAKLRELAEEAQNRGAIFSEDELEKLAEVDSAFRRIVTTVKGFGNELVVKLAPAFKDLAEKIDTALTNKPELVEKISGAFVTLIEKAGELAESITGDGEGKGVNGAFATMKNTVLGIGNTFLTVFRGIQTAISGWLTVLSGYMTAVSGVVTGLTFLLNKLGIVSDDTFESIKSHTENMWETTKGLADQTKEYGKRVKESGLAAVDSFSKARDGALKLGDTADRTSEKIGKIGDNSKKAGEGIKEFGTEQERLARKEGELGAAIELTAQAIDELGAAMLDSPTKEQAEELERLNTKYSEHRAELRGVQAELRKLENPVNIMVSTNVPDAKDDIDDAKDSIDDATGSAIFLGRESEETAQKMEDAGNRARSMGSSIADFYNNITSNLASLSQKALAAFSALTGGRGEVVTELDSMKNRVDALGEGIRTLGLSAVGAGSRLTRWFIDTATASNRVEKEFLQQKIAVEQLVDQFERGEHSSRYLGYSVRDLEREFNLLDEQDLDRLAGSIDRVQSQVDSLRDSLSDTVSSLRQELAGLQGDNEEVERLRFEERKLELQEQLNRARQIGDQEAISNAQEALRLSQQAFELRLEQAQARKEEEKQRAAEQAAEEERRRQREEAEQREQTAADFAREDRQAQDSSGRTTTIILQGPNGQRVPVQTDDEAALLDVLESLGRRVS